MIEQLVAQNYGCLRDVRVKLTPLHALIGPNDSGKSTILRAIRTLSQLAHSRFTMTESGFKPFDPGFLRESNSERGPRTRSVGTTLATPHDEACRVGTRSVRG